MSRPWVVQCEGGAAVEVRVADRGGVLRMDVDGRAYDVDALRLPDGAWSLLADGQAVEVRVRRNGAGWVACFGAGRRTATVMDAGRAALLGGPGAPDGGVRAVRAPMPGRVVDVRVAAGDSVLAGAGLVVVEAMKMENVLTAPGAGVVAAVHVRAGDAVETGQDLVVLE